MASADSSPSPDEVLALSKPTDSFLCPLDANVYDITFLSFVIKDYTSKRTLFEVGGESGSAGPSEAAYLAFLHGEIGEDALRMIQYDFNADILRLPTISTTLEFSVGANEVPDFRMIERHYFRNTLVKSFDFTFGFCIPNTTNSWEAIYDMPPLDSDLVDQMIENPYETTSDSFYFVGDRLIMHNKAKYRYFVDETTTTTGSEGARRRTDDEETNESKM